MTEGATVIHNIFATFILAVMIFREWWEYSMFAHERGELFAPIFITCALTLVAVAGWMGI